MYCILSWPSLLLHAYKLASSDNSPSGPNSQTLFCFNSRTALLESRDRELHSSFSTEILFVFVSFPLVMYLIFPLLRMLHSYFIFLCRRCSAVQCRSRTGAGYLNSICPERLQHAVGQHIHASHGLVVYRGSLRSYLTGLLSYFSVSRWGIRSR